MCEISTHFLFPIYSNDVCAVPVTYSVIEPSQIMLRLIQCSPGVWSTVKLHCMHTASAIRVNSIYSQSQQQEVPFNLCCEKRPW